MAALRTKPVRVLEADHSALRLVAGIEGRQPAAVIHAALSEYIENHRDELVRVFARAQSAIAAGDLDGLTEMLTVSSRGEANSILADIDQHR
jgi:hypothetical protein